MIRILLLFYLFLSILYSAHAQVVLPNTLSPEDKVYGLSKFWQEANYNFVYLNKVDQSVWDSTYRAMIRTVQETPNDYAYYRELQRFCALLNDGHTDVYMPQAISSQLMTTMFGEYRLFLENIDGKAVVVRVNASKQQEIPPGTEVIEVNGLPTDTYIDRYVAPYLSSSTDYILRERSVRSLLTGFEGDSYHVTFKTPEGQVFTQELIHHRTEEEEVFPAFEAQKPLLEFRWEGNGIAYVGLNSFGDASIVDRFKDHLNDLQQAKALIIDLRYNGGGNSSNAMRILQHLTQDTLLYSSTSRTRQNISMFKAWGAFMEPQDTIQGKTEWGMSKERTTESFLAFHNQLYYESPYSPTPILHDEARIVVPTVFLIGHNTASAAEDMLIMSDNQAHMIRMGEKTFGSTGQPFHFALPGGGQARICTKEDRYPDGRDFVGVGIIPHIEKNNTFEDYMLQYDAVLAAAIAYLKEQS